MNILLNAKTDVELQTIHGMIALHVASFDQHVEMITKMLDAKSDVAKQTCDRETALHIAAEAETIEVMKRLLTADVLAQTNEGQRFIWHHRMVMSK
jgi:ankyrin repeat protein